MSPEVIDLFSSQEPPSSFGISPVVNANSLVSNSLADPDQEPGRSSHHSGLIDLTDDVVVPTAAHPAALSNHKSTIKAPKRATGSLSTADEIVVLCSEDFETTTDISSHDVSTFEERASKRTRLASVRPSTLNSVQPSELQGVNTSALPGSRLLKVNPDPIEFTSSPDRHRAQDKGKGHTVTLEIDSDDDYLVGSSPQMICPDGSTRPPGPAEKKKAVAPQTISDYDNAFASSSSPPRPLSAGSALRECRSPRKPTAWDPISSSIPDKTEPRSRMLLGRSSPQLPPTRELPKAQSEVISLLDSDGQGLASDDSLPDVADLAAKVKASLGSRHSPSIRTGPRVQHSRVAKSPPLRRQVTAAKPARAAAESSTTRSSAAERAVEKQEKAAARKAESERKKAEAEAARQQKKLDKERAAALAEVNKIRTDKKQSAPEMIVDFPSGLKPKIKLQAETLLGDLKIDFTTCASPVNNVVRWRRKTRSVYDQEARQWEPIPLCITKEEHVMVLMTAAEFVELAKGDAGEGGDDAEEDDSPPTLRDHVSRMEAHFPNSNIIYLIEGMSKWMRHNRTVQNRQFAAGFRNLASQETVSTTTPASSQPAPRQRRNAAKKKAAVYVEEDIIEDALMRLQVIHKALIHHVDSEVETSQWIAVFTQHISTIPYRRHREATNDSAAFCMDSGQVRTGDDAADAYVRMLQQLARVTPAVAYGVAAEYPTVAHLVRGFEARGPLMLEACRKSSNRDGAFSDRTVGPALSRRLCKVFTGRDETSTEV